MANKFMETALDRAFLRMGDTSPNPPVGAVVVKEGRVISTGGTSKCGGPHAEVNALRSAAGNCSGADLYVSLEPCSHFGRTPPCTDAIIAAGIRNVYIPVLDPNPSVSGRGVKKLIDAGINVEFLHEYREQASALIRAFKKNISRSLPFFIHKSAMTLDGRTAACSGDSKWISSIPSRMLVHRLRAKFDAIMVGRGTVEADRPSLNVRPEDFSGIDLPALVGKISGCDNYIIDKAVSTDFGEFNHPLKVVMGLPDDLDALNSLKQGADLVIYVTADRYNALSGSQKKMCGSLDMKIFDTDDYAAAAIAAAEDLYSRGVSTVLFEGGGGAAAALFGAGLVDHFLYSFSPKIIGGGKPVIDGKGFDTMAQSLMLRDLSVYRVDCDILVSGYKEVYNFEML